MKSLPRISEAEWQVLKAVWKHAPCTAQQVMAALAPVSDWSPATVKTLLNRLTRKGALCFEKVGKSYLYSAAFTEEQGRAAEAESFLDRVFDGTLSPMIAHFIRSRRLNRRELDELAQILHEGKKKK